MLVADVKYCSEYLKMFNNTTRKQQGRLIKKYVDYYSDQEIKIKKYSKLWYTRALKAIEKYENIIRWKKYNDVKEDILVLLRYKAREQIYLQLKNKE